MSVRLGDGVKSPLEVFPQLLRGQPDLEPVPVPVQGDRVAGGFELGEQSGTLRDLLADDEEHRARTRAREDLEDRRRSFGVRTVVEGHHHAVGVGEGAGDADALRGRRQHRREQMADHAEMIPDLDRWIAQPALRVCHRRESAVPPQQLWAAAERVRLCDVGRLGRLVRWRIPGLPADLAFAELFRRDPFVVLCEEPETALVSGLVGRIWTLRRDYPRLSGAEEFAGWSRRGTARVLFANWVEAGDGGRAALVSESRVEPLGVQGRLGVRAVRPLVRAFGHLVGSEGIEAAVRLAEGGLKRLCSALSRSPRQRLTCVVVSEFDDVVTVRRTRYASEQSGWAVLDADDAGDDPVVLVGPLVHLEERERARIIGTWVDDSRYGLQVKVAEARPLPPADSDAVVAYLRRVKHVGPKRAAELAQRFGVADALEAIDRDPAGAFASVGMRRGRAQEAAASWQALRVTRQLHLLLAPHGLAYLVKRIQSEYGPQAHRIVSERPYELTRVFGVGFLIADRIARALGGGGGDVDRVRAATLHVLSEAERAGSTCVDADELLHALFELLGTDVPSELIDSFVEARDLVREGRWIYRHETAELEAELAERVRALIDGATSERLREPDSRALRAGQGAKLTDEQLAAVRGAFGCRLSLITGGPGTGKTASIRSIAAATHAQQARVMLVAPTGRAAVRMTEASGVRAKTVHSALGWVPGEGPTHDEEDPLAADLVIVDESSMANLELLVTLLRAVGPQTHVVLVGDADQLAPVGAGKPFAELVASGAVATVKLTHIFRQAAGSMIVQGAHAIRRGSAPSFTPERDMRRDLFLIERSDPRAAREEIVSLVAERLPAHYEVDPVADIQVFAPVYRGDLGIDALNESLREALNPGGSPVRGGRLRTGDKLMMTGKNLHELGLMNGTLLQLVDEVGGEQDGEERALLLTADEAVFRLPPEDADRLRLAYACSVHRGQGIELPVAVIVAHPAAGAFFLRREMLYTAVTRAKLATVIVGLPEVVARAARTPDTGRRHTRLEQRLVASASAAASRRTDR